MTNPPADLIEHIRNGKRFVIASHQRPDGNAIGSAFDEGVQVVGAAAYTAADLTLHPLRTAEEAIDTAKNLPGNAWDLVKGLVD